MKANLVRVVLAILVLDVGAASASAEDKIGKNCTFKGKKLWGKVQLVTSGGDLKAEVVDAFPDLKVQKVTSFPDACGKWQIVTSLPDLKVQLVSSFPDIKIQYVTTFPGRP